MNLNVQPKGMAFVRTAIAIAVGKGHVMQAAEYASARWGERSPPANVIRAAVAGGTTEEGNWGAPLVADAATAAAEFLALVRSQSIAGRLVGLRRVPPRTPILVQTGGGTGKWVKEGSPIPLTKMMFDRKSLETLKVASMCVVTEELLRSGDPNSEAIIRGDLIAAVAEASDAAFIDPANAGVEGEQPASVTHGVTPLTATTDLRASIQRLIASFQGNLQTAYFVGKPQLLAMIAGPDFPNVGARGGEILGIPALASNGMPDDADGNFQLALLDPDGITFAADDAAAQIKSTGQGAIEMSDDPTDPPGSGTVLVSMFQVNAIAIAALLYENWEVERPGSVALLNGIAKPEDTV